MIDLTQLQDPRLEIGAPDNEAVNLGEEVLSTSQSKQRPVFLKLKKLISKLLISGNESAVRAAVCGPGRPRERRIVLEALDSSLSSERSEEQLQGEIFAIPVIILVGGSRNNIMYPGVLPRDIDLKEIFSEVGALEYSQNMHFSNALISVNDLEKVPWSLLFSCGAGNGLDEMKNFPLEPHPIKISKELQEVHLRYLAGFSIRGNNSPRFIETASSIDRWGIKFTEYFNARFSREGATFLAMARRPLTFPKAVYDGLFASQELGFQLFLSDTLRRERMRSGDPNVSISSFSDATVRVRLTSVFDDDLDATFGWKLSPVDDFAKVLDSIYKLLIDCRLGNIELSARVVQA